MATVCLKEFNSSEFVRERDNLTASKQIKLVHVGLALGSRGSQPKNRRLFSYKRCSTKEK